MNYLEGVNKVVEAIGKLELDQNAQQTTYLGLIVMQLATIADELARMNDNNERDNLPIPPVQPKQEPVLDRVKAEIEQQYKWLLSAEATTYNIDIAFDAIRKAVRDEASKEPEQEPKISLEAYNQVTKERDIAIEQLHELGYEFGEKIEPTTKNCESCRYYGSHHEVCNYCYKCSLWTDGEPTTKNDLAQERYQDLMEYFGDKETAKTILEDKKEFKAWLERVKWHVKRADELARELEALEQEPNTWSLDDAREDFMHDVYNTLDFLPTNNEANRIIDIFDRVTSSIKQEPVLDKLRAEIEKQYKWLLSAEATTYNIDIAFDAIRKATESEKE